jgi:polyphosphate kinase
MTKANYLNREVSWVAFNERVLQQAEDESIAPLERLKFLAITASNFDEFYMVRMGGLLSLYKSGVHKKDFSGLSPLHQLKAVSNKIAALSSRQSICYFDIINKLSQNGIHIVNDVHSLSPSDQSYLKSYCDNELLPMITPMDALGDSQNPLLQNLELHLLVRIAAKDNSRKNHFIFFPLGRNIRRFISIPQPNGSLQYIPVEKVVTHFIAMWLPNENIRECVAARLTRNADIVVQEDEAADLLIGMEDVLSARITSDCVRVEVQNPISATMRSFLKTHLQVEEDHLYPFECPIHLKDFMSIAFCEGYEELKAENWPPFQSADIEPNKSIFEQIANKDILLYHPYESFDPVVRLVQEAAEDPAVLSIKQVLYRTSSNSAIIAGLRTAAANGKYVTALVELKARFDEARNIQWAQDLEQCGVQVIYGIRGYKTHSKILTVLRRESHGMVRYCHYGTGNYNESTAKLYGDISLLTSNADLGRDASTFFNSLCGNTQPLSFRKVHMAPFRLRKQIEEELESVIRSCKQGKKGLIQLKMNSLVCPRIIDLLYQASQAGAQIQINVRGICCLIPGVQGMSENIIVSSIVDKYLEHARIYRFKAGNKDSVYISSADLMQRNLDKRVELLVPVDDPNARKKLLHILQIHLQDTVNCWLLNPDGSYSRASTQAKKKVRSQQEIYQWIGKQVQEHKRNRPVIMEAHKHHSE